MPLHDTAFYKDKNGQWVETHYKELQREDRRADLKTKDLRDRRQGDIKIGIRNHQATPHFFARRPIRREFDRGSVESDAHNQKRDTLLGFLKKHSARVTTGYYEKPWNQPDKGFEKLVDTKDFSWAKEVPFGLICGRFIRFDLLGRSNSEVALTDKHPFLAIEVVDTHFHSVESFCALLKASKDLPLVIMYYFVQKDGLVNCMYGPRKLGRFPKLRVKCYISDGSFWFRDDRMEDISALSPNEPIQYYNAIKERLNTEGLIRREPHDA